MRVYVLICSIAGFYAPLSLAERPYINDKSAPENLHDLGVIENHVLNALPRAKAATVCIDLGEGSGSGVVVSEEGLILTAAHVTGGVGRELTVVFDDGRKVRAQSLGLDSENDASMAKIVEEGSYPYVPIDLDDSLRLGDWVFALGHSGGFDLERGSVVRVGRVVRVSDTTLQSDCNLIGGDSGGPLFDLEGRLVGIHSRVGARLPENMHVPIEVFRESWDNLEREEFLGDGPFAERPKKGQAFLGLRAETRPEGGLIIEKVGRESPAERSGIKVGDVLLKMDGEPLTTRKNFKKSMAEKTPDERVAFEMLRGGKVETLTLRLGNRED